MFLCECWKGEVVGWYCGIEALKGRREKISDFSYVEKWKEHEDDEDSYGRDDRTTLVSGYLQFGTADSHSLAGRGTQFFYVCLICAGRN